MSLSDHRSLYLIPSDYKSAGTYCRNDAAGTYRRHTRSSCTRKDNLRLYIPKFGAGKEIFIRIVSCGIDAVSLNSCD